MLIRSAHAATVDKLRNYTFTLDGPDGRLPTNWDPPMLYFEDRGFHPSTSGVSLRYEPLGFDWDTLSANLGNG
jgi:hypothetical protein